MNRFISRNRSPETPKTPKDQSARNREERLQRSIQSTLKSLGKRVDSSHRKIDDRRSLARPNSRGRHPEKPNKYWAASMQKSQAPAGQKIASKIGFNEDSPRATNFPDLEDFLGRAPDLQDVLNGSPSPQKKVLNQSNPFGLSPISPEDDNKSAEIIQLNQDKNSDSMDFDDPEENEEPQLTVNLNNLLGNQTPDQAQNVTNQSDRQNEKRDSTRKSKRASQLGRDQYGSTLFDFFKSLDYTPGVTKNQGTVRASYKSGRGSYNLYGVPGTKPGDKGKVFIQSQDGFDKDLPPVRLSDKQRDQLINNFQELERLTSQDDQSENDVIEDATHTKKEIPTTPNINSRAVPSRSKHNQEILKDNKTFWSSGVEKSKPVNIPQIMEKPSKAKAQPKQFQMEYNRLMGYEETVTPGGGMETPESLEHETPGGPPANKGIFHSVYSGMLSSIYGGFGGFNGTPGGEHPQIEQEHPDQKPTLKQNNALVVPISKLIEPQRAPRALSPGDEWKKPQKLPPTRDKSPMIGQMNKPNHPRFNRPGPAASKDPFQQPPPVQKTEELSIKSYKSNSIKQEKSRKPLVMKLTQEDFEPPSLDITPTSKQSLRPPVNQTPSNMQYLDYDPYEPQKWPQVQEEMDPNLPNVILLVADNVKLIRNNAVPMLQIQLEIIQSAMNYDSDMCMLGLNDVIYIVPEYTPSEYDNIYTKICTGEEYYEFKNFFDHYANYSYNPTNDAKNLPERMVGLNKNCMTAIDRDHYEPDLRGKAFVNLKNVPNGHYTIFYLRIGQPISINSRLKVLGKSKHIYVNINREKIVECKKPQLDLNHSSSRISRRETSKFKIMKAQAAKKRDNKILGLNSDDEGEEETEEPLQKQLEKKADEELEKMKSSVGTRDDSKEDTGLDMEFDDEQGPNQGKSGRTTPSSVQPPPLQDSKEYYNSTQRLTEAMIQNPQFQIYPIDEEESQRTSMRESIEYRQSIESNKLYPQIPDRSEDDVYVPNTPDMPTPHPDAPEDAFRNVHRNPNEEHSVTNNASNMPRPSTKDEISQQIEDYQKNMLAQLANFMASEPSQSLPSSRKMDTPQQKEEYKPPQVPDFVPPLSIAQQRSNFSRRDDSVKSGRSNGSARSRGTRVKHISLKELEDPKPPTPWSPGQPRVASPNRSRSSSQHNGGQPRRITEIQVKQRSNSSKRRRAGSPQQEDPFEQNSMRETLKAHPNVLLQQMSARPISRGRSGSRLSARSNQSNESGNRRPWAKKTGDQRPGVQRSRSRPQQSSKPFQMGNQQIPQTPTEKMFDRYGNPLQEDMRPRSQAQPQAHEADNSLRSPSRGQDSGRNRFFRQRSTSQGSASSAGRRRPLSNTYLGQKHKQNQQHFNENFSDDGSPARADMIQSQQERRIGLGKRF